MKINKIMISAMVVLALIIFPVFSNGVRESTKETLDDIKNIGKETYDQVKDKTSEFGHMLGEKASELGNAVGDKFSEFGSIIGDSASKFGDMLGNKASEVGENLGDALNSITSKFCYGTWKFTNGKHTTIIRFSKNKTMAIAQTTSTGNVVYVGTYKTSLNKITFNVLKKDSKTLFIKTSKDLNETWTINYSLSLSNELKLKSDDIPNDANDYDFSTPTIFTEIK